MNRCHHPDFQVKHPQHYALVEHFDPVQQSRIQGPHLLTKYQQQVAANHSIKELDKAIADQHFQREGEDHSPYQKEQCGVAGMLTILVNTQKESSNSALLVFCQVS